MAHSHYFVPGNSVNLVGRFAMHLGKLFAASGGLSHDPPLPSIKDAPPEIREDYALSKGVDLTFHLVSEEETGADHCQHDNPRLLAMAG